MVAIGLVYYSIYNSTTELLIQRTIDGIQKMITIHPPSQGEEGDGAATIKNLQSKLVLQRRDIGNYK
jgi:hypothetical protein